MGRTTAPPAGRLSRGGGRGTCRPRACGGGAGSADHGGQQRPTVAVKQSCRQLQLWNCVMKSTAPSALAIVSNVSIDSSSTFRDIFFMVCSTAGGCERRAGGGSAVRSRGGARIERYPRPRPPRDKI